MAVRPLSAVLRKKAEEELHETPERITEDIHTLRDWLKQQPHLHSVKATDQWLVAFLRGCKYNMEKTKGKVEMYYTLKATVPEFFGNRDPLDPGIQELLKLGVFLPLKKCMSEDSPRMILCRVGVLSGRSLADYIKFCLMIIEILLLEDDNFTIAGEDALVDCQDIPFSLLWQWTPSMANKVFSCVEKALSVRIKCMLLLNAPLYVGAAIRLLKMFFGAKLKKRIHWYGKGLETLYEQIDKSVLPKEYGGTDGTVEELIEYWKAKVESYRDWFLEENACSDKSKRPNNNSKTSLHSSEDK